MLSSVVSMGSIGSTKPVNSKRRVLKPVNFWGKNNSIIFIFKSSIQFLRFCDSQSWKKYSKLVKILTKPLDPWRLARGHGFWIFKKCWLTYCFQLGRLDWRQTRCCPCPRRPSPVAIAAAESWELHADHRLAKSVRWRRLFERKLVWLLQWDTPKCTHKTWKV